MPNPELLRLPVTEQPGPFDHAFTNALVSAVLEGKQQFEISPDGIHTTYGWADILHMDRKRLECQGEGFWGQAYKHWHQEVFLPTRTPETMPENMLVVGVPGDPMQVQFLLDQYPQAKILGIEIDPRNAEAALKRLGETHPEDVASGRVSIKVGNAIDAIPKLEPHSFDFVEADKVAIHLNREQRRTFYQVLALALAQKPEAVAHISDIRAKSWRSTHAPNYENKPETQAALAVLRGTMPLICKVSWEDRDCGLWDDMDGMAREALEYAPDLAVEDSLTASYEAPYTKPETREAHVSKLIFVTPLGRLQAALQRNDSAELRGAADKMRQVGQVSIAAMQTEGVLTALPHYDHLVLRSDA